MRTQACAIGAAGLLLTLLVGTTFAAPGGYAEDFSTTDYMDPVSTTAWWDATGGELTLHPHELTLEGSASFPGLAADVVLHGDYALVAEARFTLDGGLQVVDISDPSALVVVASHTTAMTALGIDVAGNYAYLAGIGSGPEAIGFFVIDLTKPDTLGGAFMCPGMPANAFGVVVDGNYAYVGAQSSGLAVIDVTDPTEPSLAALYSTSGVAHGVAVSGNYVYVADGLAGLTVVDVSDPESPGPSHTIDTAGDAWGIAVDGDYAYVADSDGGLRIFDITHHTDSQPALPAGSLPIQGNALDVAIVGDYAYVAVTESGLAVVDITHPENPQLLGYYDDPSAVGNGVAVAGEHAFLAADAGGLLAIDVADPVVPPLLLAHLETGGHPGRVEISGNYAYVPDGSAGDLHVVSIRNPRQPELVASVDTPGGARDIAIAGDYAYVADYKPGITVLDITHPDDPVLGGNVRLNGDATDVVVYEGTAFVSVGSASNSGYHNGFSIVDLSDPLHPALIDYEWCHYMSFLGRHARGLDVQDGRVYVADSWAGLHIVDLDAGCGTTEDPLRSTIVTGGEAHAVAVVGALAYVANGADGLFIADVSDYLNPTEAGRHDTPGVAVDVVIEGNYAFIADDFAGMMILNISDPGAPDSLGRYETAGVTSGLDVVGTLAFLASHDEGLEIVNVADPTNPTLLGRYDQIYWWPASAGMAGNAYVDVTVRDTLAFVTDANAGLYVINIADPAQPKPALPANEWCDLWACRTPGPARAVALADSYALVADGEYGLQVIDITDHTRPRHLCTLDGQGSSHGVTVSGDHLYFTDQGQAWRPQGMIVADIGDPLRPTLHGWNPTYDNGGHYAPRVGDLVVDGDFAFISDQWRQLTTVYVGDPANPDTFNTVPSYTYAARDVDVAGDHAYVASVHYGFEVVDIRQPRAPRHVGGTDGGQTTPMDIDLAGDYAFVAGREHGLLPIDISDPTAPDLLSGAHTPNAWGVAVAGDHAYVADYDTGLWVFSVFSREAKPDSNIAGSLPIAVGTENVTRARLNASYADSILWELSVAPLNTAWVEMLPGGPGRTFAEPDTNLRWRATLYPVEIGATPWCDWLNVEWWYDCALIDTVRDIPGDQGGWTRIAFTRSGYDFEDDSSPVAMYGVWRREDDPAVKARVRRAAARGGGRGRSEERPTDALQAPELGPGYGVERVDDRWFVSATTGRLGGFPRDTVWEYVADVPAMQQESYDVAVPTYQDAQYGGVNIFLEFAGGANYIEPGASVPFTATVYVGGFDPGAGLTAVEFALDQTFGGFLLTSTNLLDLEIGDPVSGWSLASTECVMPDVDGRVAVAEVQYIYDGVTPGTLEILTNPMTSTRLVQDCVYELEDWCVRRDPSGHGGVWAEPPEGDCGPGNESAWTVYRVSAHRADPTLWYVSPPDSGYSVDDLAPVPPGGLRIPAQLTLSWDANGEIDLDHYTIYAVDDEEALEQAEAVATTEETECVLTDDTVGRFVFVTASDLSGNESEPSELLWNTGTPIPDAHFLAQNVPNPFNPITTIRFGLPEKGRARVEVYDVAGRLVRLLAEGARPAGEHEVVWDGRDGQGHSVSSGVYFYRMEAGEYRADRKMLLLK